MKTTLVVPRKWGRMPSPLQELMYNDVQNRLSEKWKKDTEVQDDEPDSSLVLSTSDKK